MVVVGPCGALPDVAVQAITCEQKQRLKQHADLQKTMLHWTTTTKTVQTKSWIQISGLKILYHQYYILSTFGNRIPRPAFYSTSYHLLNKSQPFVQDVSVRCRSGDTTSSRSPPDRSNPADAVHRSYHKACYSALA